MFSSIAQVRTQALKDLAKAGLSRTCHSSAIALVASRYLRSTLAAVPVLYAQIVAQWDVEKTHTLLAHWCANSCYPTQNAEPIRQSQRRLRAFVATPYKDMHKYIFYLHRCAEQLAKVAQRVRMRSSCPHTYVLGQGPPRTAS